MSINIHRRVDRPRHFVIVDNWRDMAPHGPASPVTAFRAGPAALTPLDIVPTVKEVDIDRVRQFAQQSRFDAGVVRFDALTQSSRPNPLTLVGGSTSQDAKAAHSVGPAVRALRDRQMTLSGSFYDGRMDRPLTG